MRPFAYERASDAPEAVAALRERGSGATYLGGGTNLVDLMKLGVETPDTLIDVSRSSSTQASRTASCATRDSVVCGSTDTWMIAAAMSQSKSRPIRRTPGAIDPDSSF